MKNQFQKAMNNDFKDEGTFNNINESIRLAKELKVYDTINPTGKQISLMSEIISRLKVSDELEIMEIQDIEPIGRVEA